MSNEVSAQYRTPSHLDKMEFMRKTLSKSLRVLLRILQLLWWKTCNTFYFIYLR